MAKKVLYAPQRALKQLGRTWEPTERALAKKALKRANMRCK